MAILTDLAAELAHSERAQQLENRLAATISEAIEAEFTDDTEADWAKNAGLLSSIILRALARVANGGG
jgi:hypothetical protein